MVLNPRARGCMYVSQYIEILLLVNPYFPSFLCESQNCRNSKTFTTWVAAAETSLVVAVVTEQGGKVYLEADRYILPSIFCPASKSFQCQCLFQLYWLVHAISHEITDWVYVLVICSYLCYFALPKTSKNFAVFPPCFLKRIPVILFL